MDYFELNNKVDLPKIGYGTYKIKPENTKTCVLNALRTGYRHIDTARFYQNEAEVGEAVRRSGLSREEVFVTTKLWTNANTYNNAISDIKDSLNNFHFSYIDMVLIHWPTESNSEVWRAMEDMYNDGYIRAIGVSNFKRHHIDQLLDTARIKPAVNQVELHPLFQNLLIREHCAKYGIQIEAWSPLLRGSVFFDATLTAIANKYNRTIAQIVLRFLVQEGISVIPKSEDPMRMTENLRIFDFALDNADMEKIRGLNRNMRYFRDPDNHGF